MKNMIFATIVLFTLIFVVDKIVVNSSKTVTAPTPIVFNPKVIDAKIVAMEDPNQLTTCATDGSVLVNKNMIDRFDPDQIREIVENTRKLCNPDLFK